MRLRWTASRRKLGGRTQIVRHPVSDVSITHQGYARHTIITIPPSPEANAKEPREKRHHQMHDYGGSHDPAHVI